MQTAAVRQPDRAAALAGWCEFHQTGRPRQCCTHPCAIAQCARSPYTMKLHATLTQSYILQTQRSDKTKWLINMNGNGLSKGTIYFLFSLPSFSRFALRGVQKRDLPNTLMNWHLKSPCGGILACDCCSSMMKIINRISETCQKNDKNQKLLI